MDTMVKCSRCKADKSSLEFFKNKNKPNGLHPYCKACCREYGRKWRKQNPGYLRAWKDRNPERSRIVDRRAHVKRRYGLNADEYDAMLREYDGRCGICRDEVKYPHVDHDHETGRVRGLLCKNCNWLIGHAKESESTLFAAILYLRKHSAVNSSVRKEAGTTQGVRAAEKA